MGDYQAPLYRGPERIGGLVDRGTFDPYARYQPGQVVLSSGVSYVNLAPVGTDPELEDTFQRPDQVGWGQSSHGEYWETSDGWTNAAEPSVRGGVGVLDHSVGNRSNGQLLGPGRVRGDADMLCAFVVTMPASGDTSGIVVGLNTTEDSLTFATVWYNVQSDGTSTIEIATALYPDPAVDSPSEAGPALTGTQALWLRLRRVGLDYSARVWLDGAVEPAVPQATVTAGGAQPAGHPVLNPAQNASPNRTLVRYVSVRPLTAATAPADDTAHWTPLATALPVPAPL